MKGSRRTEAPSRDSTTQQLEEDLCRQNNKQNNRTTNRTTEQQTEQYSIEQMVSLRDMSYLIKSF